MNDPASILYLEDSPHDAELVRDCLKQAGVACELTVASDRAEYEAALAQTRFDLILSDYSLPDYDGMAAMALAHAKQPDVPFILISGTLGEEPAVDCMVRGATDYVLKHRLARLAPAVLRALTEAEERRKRLNAEDALALTQKQLKEELRRDEERFRQVFEGVIDGLLLSDLETKKFFMVNRAACAMLGCSEGELLTLEPQDIYSEETCSAIFARMERQIRGEDSLIPDVRMKRRDGAEFYGDINVVRVTINGRRAMMSCLRDITERRRAQEELRNIEAQLRQQQRLESIGTLACGVAHEINNPLTSIMSFAELIHANELPAEKLKIFAGKIVAESARAAKIVSNLLAFSRQDNEEHNPAQIENVIQLALSLIETVLRTDEIKVTVAVDKGLPMVRYGSRQIQQAILNLVTNARDALNQRYPGRDPGKTLSIRAERLEKEGRPWIRTIIEDRGVGIDPKISSRIFDPFFSTKPRHLGAGLGLSVSHGIVREHGGELWMESKLGEFSRFYVDLPVDNSSRLDHERTQ